MVNRVILVGNLTRDPETTTGPSTTMSRLRIATNSVWKDNDGVRQEAAEYHSIVAFGRLAEICAEFLRRGKRVYIEGRLRTREFQATDGTTRHSTEVVAETMRMLDRAPSDPAADDDTGSLNGATASEPVGAA